MPQAGLRMCVEDVCRALSLRSSDDGAWLNPKGSLHLALHPDRSRLAVAYKNEVAVFRLRRQAVGQLASHSDTPDHHPGSGSPLSPPTLLGSAASGVDDITCITWARVPSTCPSPAPSGHGDRGGDAGAAQQGGAGWAALLVACDSAGVLHLHDDAGAALFRQRLHLGPLKHLALCQASPQGGGTPSGAALLITGAGCVLQVAGDALGDAAAACRAALATSAAARPAGDTSLLRWPSSGDIVADVGAQVPPLPYRRWDLPKALAAHVAAAPVPPPPPSLYSVLRGHHAPHIQPPSAGSVVVAGAAPCLASLELRCTGGSRSMLGAALGAGWSMASDMMSAARSAGRTVTGAPGVLSRGIRSFVMAPLFGRPGGPRPAGPVASHLDLNMTGTGAPQPAPVVGAALHDPPRAVGALAPAPHGPLLAACDSLGRVLLVDTSCMVILRLWKGYRDAQCTWAVLPQQRDVADGTACDPGAHTGSDHAPCRTQRGTVGSSEPPPGGAGLPAQGSNQGELRVSGGPQCLVLLIYAPRQQVVHGWLVPHGPCILSRSAHARCRLLTAGLPPCPQPYLLDAATGDLHDLTAMVALASL